MKSRNPYFGKTLYIPSMGDQSQIFAAALEAMGLRTEILPPADDEPLNPGLDDLLGKECSSCFTATRDILCRARRADFIPSKAVLVIPMTGGPCRFGQYWVLQREILDGNGLETVDIFTLGAENPYLSIGADPAQFGMLVWDSAVLSDVLQRLLLAHRPYERQSGETDELYQEGMQRIIAATRQGGGARFDEALEWLCRRFEALPVDRHQPRPIIGLVGEIYLRSKNCGDQELIRQVEAAGGEVILSSMMEWLYYTNWNYIQLSRDDKKYYPIVMTALIDIYQHYWEHRFVRRVAHLIPHPFEASSTRLMENLRPYYDSVLTTEAVLTIGEAIEQARSGASGVLNIYPFSCMPGILAAGLAPRIRKDLNQIPWLDVGFDLQGWANFRTRLEAFVCQAIQYQRQPELVVPALKPVVAAPAERSLELHPRGA